MGITGQKIIRLGLNDLVLGLAKEGFSARKISAYIKRLKGINVSDQTIRNFLKLKKVAEDLQFSEVLKEVNRSVDVSEKFKIYEELNKALKLTNQLIEITFTNNTIDEARKTVIIDRLNRTKETICKTLSQYYSKIDLMNFLNDVFDELSTDFAEYFRVANISEDVAKKIVEILNNAFKKLSRKIELNSL